MDKVTADSKLSSTTIPPAMTGHEAKLAEAKALPPDVLLTRFRISDHRALDFFATEVLITLFREARQSGNRTRYLELSAQLADRLLKYAQRYVNRKLRWKPLHERRELKQDLATAIWALLDDESKVNYTAYAERRFGRFFKLRAIDFSRKVMASDKARRATRSLTEKDNGDDEGHLTPSALQDRDSDPSNVVELEDAFITLDDAIDTVLTDDECEAVILHYRLGIPIDSNDKGAHTVATHMHKTSRTIRNYLASAREKLKKELEK